MAVVNRSFVKKFMENREPRGLHFGGEDSKAKQYEIVGVVGDTKYDDLRKDPEPTAFIPLKKGGVHFAVRTVSNPRGTDTGSAASSERSGQQLADV